MRLFKFVSSKESVLNIARGSLKFCPLAELNDPSELTPVMDRAAVRRSLKVLRQNGMDQRQFAWLHCQDKTLNLLAPEEKVLAAPATLAEANRFLSMLAYENLDYMERKLFATIELIRSRVGILSLTERYDSLPMWAHYARNAHGYVVILDDLDLRFSGDDTGSLNALKPVVYSVRYVGMTFDPSTQDRLFFSKLEDWSYEREWRIVSALNSCDHSTGAGLYLQNVDKGHIAGVICGWQASPEDVRSLVDEIAFINPNVKICLAQLKSGVVTTASV